MKKDEPSTFELELVNSHHVAKVLARIIEDGHEASVFSENTSHSLSAKITEIDFDKGVVVLHLPNDGRNLNEYFSDKAFSLDVKGKSANRIEFLCFEEIESKSITQDNQFFKAICKLPDSVFTQDKRGELRVPFIQGIRADADLEVFKGSLYIQARLRNLSTGGCMLDIPLQECATLKTGQLLPSVSITFPNGDIFSAQGKILYIRPFVRTTHVSVGISFEELDSNLRRELLSIVNEAELEIAYRTGMSNRRTAPSPLFMGTGQSKHVEDAEQQERDKQPPMLIGVREIARQLQLILLSLKNEKPMPEDTLYDCVDTLILLLERNRQQLLYALCCLQQEPLWLRHAIRVAGLLGDMMLPVKALSGSAREAMAGALLHTMGKPLLISEELPSLEIDLNSSQKKILERHQDVLKAHLATSGWRPSPICAAAMYQHDQHPDVADSADVNPAQVVSDVKKLVVIIKTIDTLTTPSNSKNQLTPVEAYKGLYSKPEKYDKTWVTRVIQRYGKYPIGSLVRYSRGFLAWVMELDDQGLPSKIKVVTNPAFKDVKLDIVLTSKDHAQLGELETVVRAEEAGLVPK